MYFNLFLKNLKLAPDNQLVELYTSFQHFNSIVLRGLVVDFVKHFAQLTKQCDQIQANTYEHKVLRQKHNSNGVDANRIQSITYVEHYVVFGFNDVSKVIFNI